MRRLIVSLGLVLVLVGSFSGPVFAATSQDVVVTATPSFIGISNSPSAWTINSVSGGGKIATSTTYYSNPLGDTTIPSDPVVNAESRFTITNTSNIAIDLTANFPHHTGGDASTNGGTGSAGAGSFGAYGYVTGMTYSTGKVVMANSGSAVLKDALAASTNIQWGITYSSQTGDWTTGTSMTSTVVITATAD